MVSAVRLACRLEHASNAEGPFRNLLGCENAVIPLGGVLDVAHERPDILDGPSDHHALFYHLH